MTRADVQRWLDRYVAAWHAYDPTAIADLFTEDAEYRYHPYDDEPVRGRAAIVHDWLNPGGDAANRDRLGTVEATYTAFAADGERAVAIGETSYRSEPGGPVERHYFNAWLLEFDADGRCRSFVEYYMQRRRAAQP